MVSVRAISGGRRRRRTTKRRRRSGSKRKRTTSKRKRSSSRRRRSASTQKSAPKAIDGTFSGYNVKLRKMTNIKNPKMIVIRKGKGVRVMIQGESTVAPHNKITTFVSATDPRVKKYL